MEIKNTVKNPFMTTPEEQFVVGMSDLEFFNNRPSRLEEGAILFCRSGHITADIDDYKGLFSRDMLLFVLPGTMFQITERSADFRAMFCSFSRELLSDAAFRLTPSFFKLFKDTPIWNPPKRVVDGALDWFKIARYTYRDKDNVFRNTIIKNRVQNVLLEMYDKAQRFAPQHQKPVEKASRQVELFRRFVVYVYEYSTTQREVAFYADKLCISTRYLSTIVRSIANTSAKEFIDNSVLPEIKMLLNTTNLSVQEIAYKLHFHDQSYLGRFFKRHTGESPIQYRNKAR